MDCKVRTHVYLGASSEAICWQVSGHSCAKVKNVSFVENKRTVCILNNNLEYQMQKYSSFTGLDKWPENQRDIHHERMSNIHQLMQWKYCFVIILNIMSLLVGISTALKQTQNTKLSKFCFTTQMRLISSCTFHTSYSVKHDSCYI